MENIYTPGKNEGITEYGILGEGSQFSTNQERESTVLIFVCYIKRNHKIATFLELRIRQKIIILRLSEV